ncbi:MAG: DUF262 domain-containing protein [Proteobacteria bacterium]|nr:DUF262 domain-containing protein [Pseudomonadota bacterium]
MKNFDSRVFAISDFVEWDAQKTLSLNPAFQRRAVWSEKAKSYLMDTIIRGKPIPKIFIRQILNPTTKSSIREVVDGQQRLRTILSFIKDGFVISKRHNPEFGGVLFSGLDPDVQTQILSFELSVDLLLNLPNSEILDIFGRLNSYAVVLSEQEKINAVFFGPFKILADELGRKYYDYWLAQDIISENKILRMEEVNLVADLLIAMKEGVKSKKQIRKFYTSYEKTFDDNVDEIIARFDAVIAKISQIFPDGLSATYFNRVNIFYSLFIAVAHSLFGIPNFDAPRIPLEFAANIEKARNGLDHVGEVIETEDLSSLEEDERTFRKDIRLATTDESVRKRRTKYLLSLME